ncbi:UDP-N-acetylmuramate dehydrogenase [Desulfatiferula olefinivorans]
MPITEDIRDQLSRRFPGILAFEEPMSRHTSFKVGGPAQVFACPRSLEDTAALIGTARSLGLPVMVIGDGTNLLVKDGGVAGLVLCLKGLPSEILTHDHLDGRITVRAHAGVKTRDLCRLSLKNGWDGLTFAWGIPGTLGGHIAMNAGTRDGCMGRIIDEVQVIDGAGRLSAVARKDLSFSYRHLAWPAGLEGPVIVSAVLGLTRGDHDQLDKEAKRLLRTRTKSQPLSLPNAGCIFKNPANGDPAGKLIDSAGLKGLSVGGARISERHANFIVNANKARAKDILALIATVRERVFSRWGVMLDTEVQIVGQEETAS